MYTLEQKLRSALVVVFTLTVCIVLLAAGWAIVERQEVPGIDSGTLATLEGFFPRAERFEALHPDRPPFAVYGAYRDGERVGTALKGSGRGYGGPIRVLVALDMEGVIAGVAVVEQSETPGLGDVIRDEPFLDQFKGKDARNPASLEDGLDTISGATVSSLGTAEAVRNALEQDLPEGAMP